MISQIPYKHYSIQTMKTTIIPIIVTTFHVEVKGNMVGIRNWLSQVKKQIKVVVLVKSVQQTDSITLNSFLFDKHEWIQSNTIEWNWGLYLKFKAEE